MIIVTVMIIRIRVRITLMCSSNINSNSTSNSNSNNTRSNSNSNSNSEGFEITQKPRTEIEDEHSFISVVVSLQLAPLISMPAGRHALVLASDQEGGSVGTQEKTLSRAGAPYSSADHTTSWRCSRECGGFR